MEENKVPDVAPAVAPATMPVPGNQEAEPSSNKFVLILVVGLVIIVLLVGGIYMYLSRQKTKNEVNVTPPPAAEPTPVVQENLENDLNAIDVANPDADFTSLDSDLQQL